jgi:hypothetical protein
MLKDFYTLADAGATKTPNKLYSFFYLLLAGYLIIDVRISKKNLNKKTAKQSSYAKSKKMSKC